MVRAFIKGLSNKSLAEEVWRLHPVDLAEAIQFSFQEASIRDDFTQPDIKIEAPLLKTPIAGVTGDNYDSVKSHPDAHVVSLTKQIQNLSTKLAKLEAQLQWPCTSPN